MYKKSKNNFSIIFEDDNLIVVNKSAGLLVAADRYDSEAPRLDKLVSEHCGTIFAVHRIDKDTSGIVVYAKSLETQRNLSLAFQNREVKKIYHALVYGRPTWEQTTIQERLVIDGDHLHRTIIKKREGKPSETIVTFLGNAGTYSWIQAEPITGRTHQIRAHLTFAGFPIVCDPLYGGNQKPIKLSDFKRSWRGDSFEERPLLNRLGLHAYRISFNHPVTKIPCTFTAPYPRDLNALKNQLKKIYSVDPITDV